MRLLFIFCAIGFFVLSFNFRSIDFVILGNNTNDIVIKKSDKLEKSEFIIKNSFNKNLDLVWTRKSNSFIKGWDYSVCAYGQCSIGVPENGQFKTIKPGEEGFFALHLFPKNVLGSGQLVVEVHEKSNPNLKALLTFNISVVED